MKRNELLAKSLTLGLAVATAATSMSVPGGLLAPETVYAEETDADGAGTTENGEDEAEDTRTVLSEENLAQYFKMRISCITLQTNSMGTVLSGAAPVEMVWPVKSEEESKAFYGEVSITFKDEDGKNEINALGFTVGGKYKVYVNVDGTGSGLAAAAAPLEVGEVTAYEDVADNVTLTFRDGSDDSTGVNDITGKTFNNDVIVSVPDDATIGTDANVGDATSVTISREKIAYGTYPIALYVKKDGTTYAKIVNLNFAKKTAPSEMTGTASITNAQGEAVSKLTIGDTVTAKYDNEDAKNLKYQWYRVPAEGGDAVEIADATAASYTLTTADKGYKIKVIVSDETLSGSKEAITDAIVEMKAFNGTAPTFGENCFDETARTLTATVADGTTAAQLEYSLDGGKTWVKGDVEGSILAVDGTDATLKLAAQPYNANTIQIRVAETDDTEASEVAKYATEIDGKGVNLENATVKLNGESTVDFKYTGKPVIESVEVTYGEDQKLDSNTYKVYYTDRAATEAGSNTVAPTAAGDYKLWIIPASEDCYGSQTVEFSIKAITVDSSNIDTYIEYTGLKDLQLTYDGKEQCDNIFKVVSSKDEEIVPEKELELVFMEQASQEDRYLDDIVNAGTYNVYVKINLENIKTTTPVQIGTVDIAKATLKLTVTVDSNGVPVIKAGDYIIPNDQVNIAYYQGDTLLNEKPTAPGTYKVKVTYTDEANLTAPATGEADFTITNSSSGGSTSDGSSSGGSSSGGSTSGGSSAGGGASTTPSKDDSKKDDTTKTETKPDGTTVTTTETKAADGSVQTKIELKNDTTGVNATVNVAKDAQGKITGATADVNQKATDNKTAISAASIAQITEAAGTKDVEITTRTVDADGKTVREVTVNASDLTAGKKLKVVAVDPETGEKTLVNKTTYKVAADGSLALDNLGNANYEVVTTTEVNALTKEILQSIRPEKSKANIVAGKKTSLSLDDALNMDNVAKITYKTSKKSVATVNSNGTITAKKAGKVTIKATVTLNNGKKKTIRMNLTVKARK